MKRSRAQRSLQAVEVRISCAPTAQFLHLRSVMFVNNLLSHLPTAHQESFHWLCCPLHRCLCGSEALQRKAPQRMLRQADAQSPQLMADIDLAVKLLSRVGEKKKKGKEKAKESKGMEKLPPVGSGKIAAGSLDSPSRATGTHRNDFPVVDV